MAKAKTTARIAEVVAAESPDLAVIETDGAAVTAFMRNIVAFFRTATQLEQAAQATLGRAKLSVAPTTADEDTQIQIAIKGANTDRKALDAHWSICQTFSQVHRKLTAGRSRGTAPLDEAAAIWQRHHNTYAEAARRKAAEEQDRVRLAAEAKARADQAAEAKRLDDEAVRLEEASADLSDREQMFIERVVNDHTPPQRAAELVGFKDAFKAAARLMSLPKIQRAIKAKQDAAAAREQAAAVREQPLDVQVETVRAEVVKAPGAHDRTTHSATVLDPARLIAAVISGGYGIPADVLMPNPVKINEYARSLQARIDLWPGVQYVKSTKTV